MISWLLRRYYNKKYEEEKKIRDDSQKKIEDLTDLLISYERRLSSIIESQQEMVCRFKEDTTLTFANNAYCRTFNQCEQDLLNKPFIEYVKEEDKHIVFECIQDLSVDYPTCVIQNRVVINNEILWHEWSNTAIFDDKNKIVEYQSVGRDITVKKKLEYELKTQNKLLNSILESSSDLVMRTCVDGDIFYANQSYRNTFFEENEEYIGVNFIKHHVLPEYQDAVKKIIKNVITFLPHRYEYELQSKTVNGDIRWYHIESVGIKGDNGNSNKIVQIQSISRDITEQKENQLKVKTLLDDYDTLLNNVNTIIWYVTDPETMGSANQAYADFFGLDKDKIVGCKLKDIMDSENLETCLKNNNRIFKEGITIKTEEYTTNSKGETRCLLITKRPKLDNTNNIVKYIVASSIDITDRKNAEQKIVEHETELKLILDAITDGIWQWDVENDQMKFSDRYYTMLGYTPDEFDHSYDSWVDLLHPHDKTGALKVVDQFFAKQDSVYENEFRLRRKDCTYSWIYTKAKCVKRDQFGNVSYLVGNHVDITERKKSEICIYESEKKYRKLIETTNTGFVIINSDGIVLDANFNYLKMTGRDDIGDIIGHCVLEWTSKDYIESNKKAIKNCISEGFIRNYETEYESLTGSIIPVEVNATVIPLYEHTISKLDKLQILTLCRDITICKKREKQISNSEEKFRLLAENSIDVIWKLDLAFNVTYISTSVLDLTGYTFEEYLLLPINKRYSEKTIKKLMDLLKEGLQLPIEQQKLIVHRVIGDVLCKNGNIIPVEMVGRGIFKDDKLIGVQGSTKDITEKVKYEKELKRQRDLYDNVLETQKDYVVRYDKDKKILYSNKVYNDLLFDGNSCIGSYVKTDLVHPDDRKIYDDYFNKLQFFPYMEEATIRVFMDGDYRYFHLSDSSILDDSGEVIEIQSVGRDMTDYFKLENKLKYKNKILSGILENQIACIARSTKDRKIVYANKAYARTFCGSDTIEHCYDEHDFIEQVHPDDVDIVLEGINYLVNNPTKHVSIEYRIKDFSKEIRLFHWDACGILNDKGDLCEIQAVGYDIMKMVSLGNEHHV